MKISILPVLSLAAFLLMLSGADPSSAQDVPADVIHDLAPTGTIRVAINYGNAVLAQRDAATGEPRGISAALARALSLRLRTPLQYVTFEGAGQVVEALGRGAWDVTFLAIDPVRSASIDFTAPYVLIEGGYLVTKDSPLHAIADVDRSGIRLAVGKGSAYDLYLSRSIQHATLVRAPTSAAALHLYQTDRLDVAAGVRAPLQAFAGTHPDYRVLPGRFMEIDQAMGTPKGRSAGARYLKAFLEDMKASGFVARALAESGQSDAVVAPPQPMK